MKRKKLMAIIIVAVLIVSSFFIFSLRLQTTFYNIKTDKINSKIRIVQISDLHSDRYGEHQDQLKAEIEKLYPDIVVFTGDIIHCNGDDDNSYEILRWAGENYSCFYVTGNHEFRRKEADKIKETVKGYDLTVLDGKISTVEINGERLNICGVDDRDSDKLKNNEGCFRNQVEKVRDNLNREYYSVFLCHRPQITDVYQEVGADLVLSGHAHGGQWRLPFFQNGLFHPDEGLFPEYSAGLFEFEDYKLIVSRGLAKTNTIIPRIFNRPELVVIDIE